MNINDYHYCDSCDHHAIAKKAHRGEGWMELILWILWAIPSAWFMPRFIEGASGLIADNNTIGLAVFFKYFERHLMALAAGFIVALLHTIWRRTQSYPACPVCRDRAMPSSHRNANPKAKVWEPAQPETNWSLVAMFAIGFLAILAIAILV
jgi:hypothetical protein